MNHEMQDDRPDADYIRRALDAADINALRLALYQQTNDPELAAMPVNQTGREGSPFTLTQLSKAHHETVKNKAFEYLTNEVKQEPNTPDKTEATKLMNLFCGRELAQPDVDYAWGDLAFDGFVRGAKWNKKPSQEVLDNLDITIVGAGFGGLLAAIQFTRLGIPFRIVERQDGIGGTWWLNDYLEARVDVSSFLYQYKFELGYPWEHFFPTQKELLVYFDHIVDKYELREKISLSTKVTDATWSEEKKKWTIQTAGPDGEETFHSDFFISASGQFSTAQLPKIEGIDEFEGKMFHSTQWDHEYDLDGKRVALIGTGSTGSQMTRGVAERAASLSVYQRSPNWIMQMPLYRDKVPDELHWLIRTLPGYVNWHVFSQNIAQMRMDGINEVDPEWVAQGGRFNERNDQLREILKAYIKKAVKGDERLYEQLVPDYAPLARRPVVDNNFYKTLTEDHVELITDPIEKFTADGIVAGGESRPYDLVLLCAGFEVERFLWPVEYSGRNGATLDKLWATDGPRAYLTAMLPGFPNFAMMYGPNSGLVAGSYHSWVELFSNYYCQVIVETIESGARSFEVTQEAYDAFNEELDERAKTWVFQLENTGGGYYKNAHGRSSVRLPWRVPEFYQKVATPNFNDFKFD